MLDNATGILINHQLPLLCTPEETVCVVLCTGRRHFMFPALICYYLSSS